MSSRSAFLDATGRPDVYARQGFGYSTGIGNRPAIVVVDFTRSFVDPAQSGGGNIAEAVAATAALLAAARHAGWPIAYSRAVYVEEGSDAGPFARKVPGLLTQTTVVDAVSHGFATVVAVDCVGDRALAPHEASLFDMSQKYADVLHSRVLIETARQARRGSENGGER